MTDGFSPLNAGFAAQAIHEYAKEVVASKDKLIAQQEEAEKNKKLSIIDIRLWIKSAEEFLEMYENNKH